MTKTTQKIIIIALILLVGGFLYYTAVGNPFARKDAAPQKNMGASPGATSSPTICYLKRTMTSVGKDDMALRVVFFKDGRIEGDFNLLPAEKDNMTGILKGTWKTNGTSTTRLAITNYAYESEGLKGNQSVNFKIAPETAEVSWDKGKSYPNSLTRVSCNQLR